jgi:hypothetical protein
MSVAVSDAWARQGRFSCRFSSSGAASGAINLQKSISAVDEVFLRFYVRISTLTPAVSGDVYLAQLRSATGSCAQLILVQQNNNTHLQLHYYSGQNLYKTSTNPLLLNTVYCVELHFKRGASNAELEVYLDGAKMPELSVSGANINAACTTILL